MFAVGVITCVVAVLERLIVSPQTLVVLGAARYFQEFLNLAPATRLNEYGLPDNYWTAVGDYVVRRAGSTYLSSQGFAVPFLLVLPAATLWVFAGERRRSILAAAGYALLWTGLLLSVTRVTTIVCVLQVLLLAAARRRWEVAVSSLLLGLVGAIVALLVVPGLATFAWETLTWQTGSSVAHLSDWSEGVESLIDHPLGIGLGASGLTAVRFGLPATAADSQFFKYSVEMGIPGLVFFVAMLLALAAAGVKLARGEAGRPAADYGALVAVSILGLALNGVSTVPLTTNFFAYVLFWLAGVVVTRAARAA
jgi:O-antigen ligase